MATILTFQQSKIAQLATRFAKASAAKRKAAGEMKELKAELRALGCDEFGVSCRRRDNLRRK